MAYDIFIYCDRDECTAREKVPQPGAVPMNWIQVRYAKPNLNGREAAEPTVLTLCGWRCLLKHIKGFVREEVETVK
jgi:hypothetical protein